jgi:hypothetical protein
MSAFNPIDSIPSQPVAPPNGSVPIAPTSPIVMVNSPGLQMKPGNTPPPPQIAQKLTSIPLGYQFAYNQLVSPTPYGNIINSYRIYRNTKSNNFSGALLIRTMVHDKTHQGSVTVQDTVSGTQTYYYFITAVDTFGQESTSNPFQSGAVTSGNANPNALSVVGTTGLASTTSGTYSVVPEMTLTATFHGGKVLLIFTGSFTIQTSSGTLTTTGEFAIFRDGVQLSPATNGYFISNGANESTTVPNTNIDIPVSIAFIDQPSAGSHTYDVRWAIFNGPGTLLITGPSRNFQAVELG